MPPAAEVRLLDVDPDLGALLDIARREQAQRELIVRTHRLPIGPWDVSRLAGASADHIGLLIVNGVLARELRISDQASMELLGAGDLVRPWQSASHPRCCPWTPFGRCSRHSPSPFSTRASRRR